MDYNSSNNNIVAPEETKMSKNIKESAAELIIKAIQESDNPDKAAETAISAICSFLSLQGQRLQAPSSVLPVSDLSIAG